MKTLYIQLKLKSDTTFGRGDGVAGLVDAEVEHDEYGLPFLRGRSLKGLLVEECVNLLYGLNANEGDKWHAAAKFLFGQGGSRLTDDGEMTISDARLPEDLRQSLAYEVTKGEKDRLFTVNDVLESLTTIRRQTAMTAGGAPREGSLRSMRVVLRETVFESELSLDTTPDKTAQSLLAACVKSLRRIGTGRNRGRGRVEALLAENSGAEEKAARDFTDNLLKQFAEEVSA